MRKTLLFLGKFNWIGLCALSMYVFGTTCQAQEPVDLKINFARGKQARIACDFSHSGTVLVNSEDQEKITSLPLDVNAKMTFFQRTTGAEQSIRYFKSASGRIKIENGTSAPSLDPSNRLIVARLRSNPGGMVEMASMIGVLEQSELELIQNPADPMTLPAVFNKNDVKAGDKWKPSTTALAKMLRVNKINQSSVQLMLKKVDANSARVYIMGSVAADVDDVSTRMEINGIAMIDLKSQMLSSFKLGIRETRGQGQIAPGFEGKTKIDIQITAASTPELSSSSLAKHTKNRKIRQRVKWQSQTGNFIVQYEPRWKMVAAEQEAAILRFIDQNELLTQCNIVQLPSRPADNPLTLEAYKTEVAKVLTADKNAQLISAASVPTKAGHAALRVVVAGEEDGLPVNWFYYHVAAKDGRQVTIVFTMAKSVAKRVTTIATQLVNEFEFQPVPKIVASANRDNLDSKTPPATSQKR